MREALEKILPEARQFPDFEVEHQFENIGRKIMLLSAREIQQPARYEKKRFSLRSRTSPNAGARTSRFEGRTRTSNILLKPPRTTGRNRSAW